MSMQIFRLANIYAAYVLKQSEPRQYILAELHKPYADEAKAAARAAQAGLQRKGAVIDRGGDENFIRAVLAWYWVTGERTVPLPYPCPCYENASFKMEVNKANHALRWIMADKFVPELKNPKCVHSMSSGDGSGVGFRSGFTDIDGPRLMIVQAADDGDSAIYVSNKTSKSKVAHKHSRGAAGPCISLIHQQ